MALDCIVVGAGISGLACARKLSAHGWGVAVLEKSRGVGGRCATRRIAGQPVDQGPAFYHGRDPAFLRELDAASPETLLPRWPTRVQGRGTPCLPRAFRPGEWRLAFADGMTAFPKRLARGLDVRRGRAVSALRSVRGGWQLKDTAGGCHDGRSVVLALPVPQSLELLEAAGWQDPVTRSIRRLLAAVGVERCLTVIAGYPRAAPAPDWQVCYPEDSRILMLLSHDSSKRRQPAHRCMVYQARPCWSKLRWDEAPERWSAPVVEEAGRIAGSWAASPNWVQTHRWRFSRTVGASEFSAPLLLRSGSAGLGVTGEAFAPAGGIEAAWRAGRAMAERLLDGNGEGTDE